MNGVNRQNETKSTIAATRSRLNRRTLFWEPNAISTAPLKNSARRLQMPKIGAAAATPINTQKR